MTSLSRGAVRISRAELIAWEISRRRGTEHARTLHAHQLSSFSRENEAGSDREVRPAAVNSFLSSAPSRGPSDSIAHFCTPPKKPPATPQLRIADTRPFHVDKNVPYERRALGSADCGMAALEFSPAQLPVLTNEQRPQSNLASLFSPQFVIFILFTYLFLTRRVTINAGPVGNC